MNKRFFITATGTDIGKTFISAALVTQAKKLGKTVMAYKPVMSGFDPTKIDASDTGLLLQSMQFPATPENIELVSPWRYTAPLAPSMAARMENRPIDFDALGDWSKKAASGPEDIVIIEGVGGIMVPLDDHKTILDWAEVTAIPALLVTGSYLGTISHTLTALSVLEQRKIQVAGVIVNESPDSSVDLGATEEELKRWTKSSVISIKRRTSADGWKNVTELQALFN